jgi:ferric-dicitrate binding protein FerR (iron transport regulator)
MTEDEKKEYEEFLQWKVEKAKKEEAEKQAVLQNAEGISEDNKEATKDCSSKTSSPSDSKKEDFPILTMVIAVIVILLLFIWLVNVVAQNQQNQ